MSMKNINKKVINEISSGQNLEVNIPVVLKGLSSVYQGLAGIQFVMHYFNVYESMIEKNEMENKENADNQFLILLNSVNQIVKENVLEAFDGEKREEAIKLISNLRATVIKKMKVLTYYSDIFSLYEYILNRIELNYQEDVSDMNNEEVSNEIIQYIFSDKDNMVINERIKDMLYQLPVRITKSKFFDLLMNSLMLYIDAPKEAVSDYSYRLLSSAGIHKPDGIAEEFLQLATMKEQFNSIDYGALSEDEYQGLRATLDKASNYIIGQTDYYYGLQEVINTLTTVLLNLPYASEEVTNDMYQLQDLIKQICDNIEKETYEEIPEQLVHLFAKTEGKLEQLTELSNTYETVFGQIQENYRNMVDALCLQPLLSCLELSQMLMSSSLFIEQTKNEEGNADKKYIEDAAAKLIEEFSKQLKEQSKYEKRAMIAATLKEMPVLFANQEEVANYVKNSIASCHDIAEKMASIALLRDYR